MIFSHSQDDKNLGESTILKLVDNSHLGQYVKYPIDIVKFKKGMTPDPTDDNSLWDITYNPTDPQRLWWDSIRHFDATYSYNEDKCEWTDLCPSNVPSDVPSAPPSNEPSSYPSSQPSSTPSHVPSVQPSSTPSQNPSTSPTVSFGPSLAPSTDPSYSPSISFEPSISSKPSSIPTLSSQPSSEPSTVEVSVLLLVCHLLIAVDSNLLLTCLTFMLLCLRVLLGAI